MQIGESIKNARTQAGLTQAELSGRLGVTPQVISQYERGVKNPKVETVKKIAGALGVPWYELYSGEATEESKKEIDLLFRDLDKATKTDDYRERVEDASAYLLTLRYNAGYESDAEWASDEVNGWLKRKLPEVAKMFNVAESDLDDELYWEYPENEKYLTEIHEAVMRLPIRFRSLEKICRALLKMNVEGQTVAADRVQELTQIPKYQRPTETPSDAPGGADDKEPAEK